MCCVSGLLGAIAAQATELQTLSAAEMGSAADAVIRGRVQTTRSFWNDDRTKIYTEIAVAAEQTYKGDVAGLVHVLQLGGTVDNVRVTVHGALDWTVGEEVLLFLEPFRENRFVVTGLSQGKYLVERDPATGEAYAARVPVRGDGPAEAGAAKAREKAERQPLAQLLAAALGAPARERQD